MLFGFHSEKVLADIDAATAGTRAQGKKLELGPVTLRLLEAEKNYIHFHSAPPPLSLHIQLYKPIYNSIKVSQGKSKRHESRWLGGGFILSNVKIGAQKEWRR